MRPQLSKAYGEEPGRTLFSCGGPASARPTGGCAASILPVLLARCQSIMRCSLRTRQYRLDPQRTGGVDITVATLVCGRKVGTLAEPQQ